MAALAPLPLGVGRRIMKSSTCMSGVGTKVGTLGGHGHAEGLDTPSANYPTIRLALYAVRSGDVIRMVPVCSCGNGVLAMRADREVMR